MTKISIAMTTYNGEQYVLEQINSLYEQSYQADEIIICDDCSHDNTISIIKNFIEVNHLNHWKLYVNEFNVGFIKNFYNAIEKTSGDIIFLCDQDDIWYPDKIEKSVKLFENKDIKIINTSFRKIDSTGNPIQHFQRYRRSNNNLIKRHIKNLGLINIDFNHIIWRNISPGCTAAFIKECKDFYLKYASGYCPHDWELNFYGSIVNGLYYYNEILMDYRIHQNNTIGFNNVTFKNIMSVQYAKKKERLETENKRADNYLHSNWFLDLNPKQKKIVRRFSYITCNRFRYFSEGKFSYWLLLLFHLSDYIKWVGIHGFVEDFMSVTSIRRHIKNGY